MAKLNGYDYERAASRWLVCQGCRLVTSNYRCRVGEIDLVMTQGDTLIFVEVRVRTNPRFASAAASVDRRKQQRLSRAAAHYLQRHCRGREPVCRFDVVVWEPAADSGKLHPRWLTNAFPAA
ncbi:MAG: YraN family protein [Chromatocurvus sp.]